MQIQHMLVSRMLIAMLMSLGSAAVFAACPTGYSLTCPTPVTGIATAPDVGSAGGGTPITGNLTMAVDMLPWPDSWTSFLDVPFTVMPMPFIGFAQLSAARWRAQSGAALTVNVTTCGGDDCGILHDPCDVHGNGISTVGLIDGYFTSGATTHTTWACCNADGVAAEVDICLADASSAAAVFAYSGAAGLPSGAQDLVGALVHAFGVAWGLTLEPNTAMTGAEPAVSLVRQARSPHRILAA